MPLPESGPWPPPELAPVTSRIASWSAWYGGDPDTLASVYGGIGLAFDATSRQRLYNHPSQYRGGVLGTMARWFWGAPIAAGERRTKLHVPLAGDIAATSAGLLFAEPPAYTLADSDTVTEDRMHALLDDTWQATLLEAGEVCAGLGGVYLRVVWDDTLSDRPWISVVHADNAVPEWRHGRLSAVTFWRVVHQDDQRVLRHLERHEPGVILHGLYEGDPTTLGRRIPLTEHAETRPLAEALTDGDVIDTGVSNRLTAVYVPNLRPNRLWRTLPAAAPLGRSDYSGVESLMDALDETWTSWMRDIRLGKAKLLVPQEYLESPGLGQGAMFDPDRELYAGLNIMQKPDGGYAPITPSQFDIRVEEHSRSAQELIAQIIRGCGYSGQTFGLTGEVAATATEVVARERESYVTRAHKILYWRSALTEIIETLLMVDVALFSSGITPVRPDIEWPDGVAVDPEAQARTLQLLAAAEAASTQTKVEMLHPDWPEERVNEEVDRIHGNTGQATADPVTFLQNAMGANPVPPQ